MKGRAFFAACVVLLLALPAKSGQDIAREIDRVDSVLQSIDPASLDEGFRPAVAANRTKLTGVRTIDSPLLQLYKLREPFQAAELLRFMVDHKAAGKTLPEFQSLWTRERTQFSNLKSGGSAGLQKALAQIGVNRAEKLYRASLPYAKADEPSSGLYYLAEAEANRKWAAFISSLPALGSSRATRPQPASIRSGLDALEKETILFFEKDLAGRSAIPVSVRMKESRELLDRGSLEGARLLLLDAQLELARRTATPPPASDRDPALLALWEAAPPPKVALKPAKGPARKVKVTLIRWPYT